MSKCLVVLRSWPLTFWFQNWFTRYVWCRTTIGLIFSFFLQLKAVALPPGGLCWTCVSCFCLRLMQIRRLYRSKGVWSIKYKAWHLPALIPKWRLLVNRWNCLQFSFADAPPSIGREETPASAAGKGGFTPLSGGR